MNSLYASLSLILAEVTLFLLVVCSALIFLKIKEQRKDKKALLTLTEKIKENEEERLNVLSIKLKETHELDSDALSATAKKILGTEIELYITMMNIYADRDSEALKNLDKNIAALTESNTKLSTINIDSRSPTTDITNNAAFNELKNENSRLQHELTATQKTNDRLEKELDTAKKEMRETVTEFISAFSGGRDAAEEILAKKEKKNFEARETASKLPDESPTTRGEKPIENSNHAEKPEINKALPANVEEAKEGEENNPFLSIDSNAIANNDTESARASVDHATDESDLDIDLGLNIDPTPQSSTEMSDKTDAPAADDIDTLLATNTNDTPSTPETKSSDEALDPDDIDALLAASVNDAPDTPASDTKKDITEKAVETGDIDALLTANTSTKEPSQIPSSEEEFNIDAILEDIDITTASAVPNNKKEVEKASGG